MFQVPNPSIGFKGMDTDKIVPSDSPYATSSAFLPSDPNSCVVPERAIGRIPDMVSDPDPAWLLDYLNTATKWKPRDATAYQDPYAICTAEAQDAATDFMQQAFAKAGLPLFICPPDDDSSPKPRGQLSAGVHVTKCHGNMGDATFWGFSLSDQRTKDHPYPALTSATLRALLKPFTVVASMCCYGAQIFSPSDPKARSRGKWPIASAYLRKGALGFVGPTMMAWVGRSDMEAADWIVQGYLKNILAGGSLGGAFLACKQDYHSHYTLEDRVSSVDELKTLIEYILLGDPSIHPIPSSQSSKGGLAVPGRRRRRVAREKLATGIRDFLPTRSDATDAEKAMAKDVFSEARKAIASDDIKRLKKFGIKRTTAAEVKRVDAPVPASAEVPQVPRRVQRRQSLEYYWCGQRDRGQHKQFCLLKAETDRQGVLSRASVVYSS
jgi:hypothetical protein